MKKLKMVVLTEPIPEVREIKGRTVWASAGVEVNADTNGVQIKTKDEVMLVPWGRIKRIVYEDAKTKRFKTPTPL